MKIYGAEPYVRYLGLTIGSFTQYTKGQSVPWSDSPIDVTVMAAPLTVEKGDFSLLMNWRVVPAQQPASTHYYHSIGRLMKNNLTYLQRTVQQEWSPYNAALTIIASEQQFFPLTPGLYYYTIQLNDNSPTGTDPIEFILTNIWTSTMTGIEQE